MPPARHAFHIANRLTAKAEAVLANYQTKPTSDLNPVITHKTLPRLIYRFYCNHSSEPQIILDGSIFLR